MQPKPKSTFPPAHRGIAARESTQAPRESILPPLQSTLAPRASNPIPRASVPPGRDGSFRPRSDEPVVLDSEPGAFLFGAWKNVLVVFWESQATMNAVDRMVKASNTLNGIYPSGRSNVHIIADGAGLPTPEVRAHFVELMKTHAEELACVGVVVGGTGFWTSALRSFVTGLRWLAPRSFDFRLFGTVHEVARWLPPEHAKRTAVHLDSRRLVHILETWSAPRLPGSGK